MVASSLRITYALRITIIYYLFELHNVTKLLSIIYYSYYSIIIYEILSLLLLITAIYYLLEVLLLLLLWRSLCNVYVRSDSDSSVS